MNKNKYKFQNLRIKILSKFISKKKILSKDDDIETRFTKIYSNNYWGNKESVSGSGSTLEYTENIRNGLNKLINQYSITSIFDAPCGDFNWMKLLIKNNNNIQYIGGDIVKPLIESNIALYQSERVKFKHIDLTSDTYPYADLMFCRDCLFHLSYNDIK